MHHGPKAMPAITSTANPLYSAYSPAKSLPASVCVWARGPMPDRIIAAFRKASSHAKPSKKWYPAIPAPNDQR